MQAAHAVSGGSGPASPPPCRGFKSMKMRWLRQYEDETKQQSGNSESGDHQGSPPSSERDAKSGAGVDDGAAAMRSSAPQHSETQVSGARALATGAASSPHAPGTAEASAAASPAATDQPHSASAPLSDPDTLSIQPGELRSAGAAGLAFAADQAAGAVPPDCHTARERHAYVAALIAAHGTVALSPRSMAAESGAGAPFGPSDAAGPQDTALMLLTSEPAEFSTDGPSRPADTIGTGAAAFAAAEHAAVEDEDLPADKPPPIAAPREAYVNRGISSDAAGNARPSEGGADSSAGHSLAASSAVAGAGEVALALLPPPDAGDGSASDTWDSPDLPPHLAKLGLRMDAPPALPAPPRRLDFGGTERDDAPSATGHAAGALFVTASVHHCSVDCVLGQRGGLCGRGSWCGILGADACAALPNLSSDLLMRALVLSLSRLSLD